MGSTNHLGLEAFVRSSRETSAFKKKKKANQNLKNPSKLFYFVLYILRKEMEVHWFEGTGFIPFEAADNDFAGEDMLENSFFLSKKHLLPHLSINLLVSHHLLIIYGKKCPTLVINIPVPLVSSVVLKHTHRDNLADLHKPGRSESKNNHLVDTLTTSTWEASASRINRQSRGTAWPGEQSLIHRQVMSCVIQSHQVVLSEVSGHGLCCSEHVQLSLGVQVCELFSTSLGHRASAGHGC